MQLSVRSFSQYVQDMASAMQASSRYALDLSLGSVIRSILEAQASVALWLQVLIADALEASRAGTARGNDLDAWMADFGIERLPATHASGHATFSRSSAVGKVLIPGGTRTRSSSSNISFTVVVDTSHVSWNAAGQGYLLSNGQASVTLPIQADLPGLAGNVITGSITLLSSSVAGLDDVVNEQPTVGGADAEGDSALRQRFTDYLLSRSRATRTAIAFAIMAARQGLRFSIHENVSAGGLPSPGHSVVIIDDGTRQPTNEVIFLIYRAIEDVRPIGSTFSVRGPDILDCDITCSVTLSNVDTVVAGQIRTAATEAVRSYVLQLGISEVLPITRLAQVIYATDSRITNVLNVSINGATSDIVPGMYGAVSPRLVAVS